MNAAGEVQAAAGLFNWDIRDSLVRGGLVLAVVCAAGAVFTGQMFAAVGYALLGVATFWMTLEGPATVAAIEGIRADEEADQAAVEGLQRDLRAEAVEERVDSAAVQHQIADLQRIQQELTAVLQQRAQQHQELLRACQTMEQDKAALQEQVAQLMRESGELRDHLQQQFTEQNQALTAHIAALHGESQRGAQLVASVQALDIQLTRDAAEIARQIQSRNEAAKAVAAAVQLQMQAQKRELDELRASTQRTAALEAAVRSLNDTVGDGRDVIQALEQIRAERQALAQERAELKQIVANFKALKEKAMAQIAARRQT